MQDQTSRESSVPGMSYFNGSKSMVVTGTILTILTVAAFITVTIFLGIFAYANPDPNSCWVVRDLENTERTEAAVVQSARTLSVDITEGYPIEMHKIFSVWFIWGFWTSVAYLTIFAIGLLVAKKNVKTAKVIISTITGFFCTNAIVWIVMGILWRFSKAGSVASGDRLERTYGTSDKVWAQQMQASAEANGYQLKGGMFMKIYLLLMVVLIGTILIAFVIGFHILCFCDPRKSKGPGGEPYASLENNGSDDRFDNQQNINDDLMDDRD